MANITIVGTSHIAEESINKIKNTINKEKPDCIAVELDPARYHALLNGRRKVSLRYGLMNAILSSIQKKLGEKTGVMPGTEILAAINCGKEIGSKVVLIDMDISETLNRMRKIKLSEKLKLFFSIFTGLAFQDKIDLNKIPSDKIVKKVLKYMRKEFPSLYKILIEDRNEYMCNWIKRLSEEYKKIVVVVGIGHIEGLKRRLK